MASKQGEKPLLSLIKWTCAGPCHRTFANLTADEHDAIGTPHNEECGEVTCYECLKMLNGICPTCKVAFEDEFLPWKDKGTDQNDEFDKVIVTNGDPRVPKRTDNYPPYDLPLKRRDVASAIYVLHASETIVARFTTVAGADWLVAEANKHSLEAEGIHPDGDDEQTPYAANDLDGQVFMVLTVDCDIDGDTARQLIDQYPTTMAESEKNGISPNLTAERLLRADRLRVKRDFAGLGAPEA